VVERARRLAAAREARLEGLATLPVGAGRTVVVVDDRPIAGLTFAAACEGRQQLANTMANGTENACKSAFRCGLEERYPSLGGSRVQLPPLRFSAQPRRFARQ
jgi:hypothetical protein